MDPTVYCDNPDCDMYRVAINNPDGIPADQISCGTCGTPITAGEPPAPDPEPR